MTQQYALIFIEYSYDDGNEFLIAKIYDSENDAKDACDYLVRKQKDLTKLNKHNLDQKVKARIRTELAKPVAPRRGEFATVEEFAAESAAYIITKEGYDNQCEAIRAEESVKNKCDLSNEWEPFRELIENTNVEFDYRKVGTGSLTIHS